MVSLIQIWKRLIIHEIDDSCPDILVVGMGTPLQEEFLLKCVDKLTSVKEFYTCGGFLEQTASKGRLLSQNHQENRIGVGFIEH